MEDENKWVELTPKDMTTLVRVTGLGGGTITLPEMKTFRYADATIYNDSDGVLTIRCQGSDHFVGLGEDVKVLAIEPRGYVRVVDSDTNYMVADLYGAKSIGETDEGLKGGARYALRQLAHVGLWLVVAAALAVLARSMCGCVLDWTGQEDTDASESDIEVGDLVDDIAGDDADSSAPDEADVEAENDEVDDAGDEADLVQEESSEADADAGDEAGDDGDESPGTCGPYVGSGGEGLHHVADVVDLDTSCSFNSCADYDGDVQVIATGDAASIRSMSCDGLVEGGPICYLSAPTGPISIDVRCGPGGCSWNVFVSCSCVPAP